MIEYQVWLCLAVCKLPIAIFFYSNVSDLIPICNPTGHQYYYNGIKVDYTGCISYGSIYDKIYITKTFFYNKALNDLCYRYGIEHELYRSIHHDSSLTLGNCGSPTDIYWWDGKHWMY